MVHPFARQNRKLESRGSGGGRTWGESGGREGLRKRIGRERERGGVGEIWRVFEWIRFDSGWK